MSELLSPAGTLEAFNAAINNGADAIYLGLDRFSARAYATNFTLENLKPLVDYAHLRNVKIHVTINTIAYDDELEDMYECIDELAKMGVDAIIVQDLAILHYITNKYVSLKAHASTQMGVDDLDAAKLVQNLGVTRIVFARETKLETIKEIKEKLHIEVEAFIHGALCVSYSGNCLMSSMIGERSGNRGRCAGCCRRVYSLVNQKTQETINKSYLLSMKDLNTSSNIEDMRFIDSFKIEGRMKEPNYVASVTNIYRNIIDKNPINKSDLLKVFNRTYTTGLLNNDKIENLTNIERPNNYGYLIGEVVKQYKNKIWIKLVSSLSKGDQVRIENNNLYKEISLPVTKMFDFDTKEIIFADKNAVIYCDHAVKVGAKVYKTKDAEFVQKMNATLNRNKYEPIEVKMTFVGMVNSPLKLTIEYLSYSYTAELDYIVAPANSSPTTKDNVYNQLSKLNDTPYCLKDLSIEMDENAFIPLKLINELRREVVNGLDEARKLRNVELAESSPIIPQKVDLHEPVITVEVANQDQYDAAQEMGVKHIYFKNSIRRNNAFYKEFDGEVLVGGLGGVNHYKDTNPVVSDYSLNVTNHITVALLSSLGVERITLSQEISKERINSLLARYKEAYKTNPNLELIVYGRAKLMHTKYCPLKRLGLCGSCKKTRYLLQDDYASFPLYFNDDCTMYVLNDKPLNLIDELEDLKGVNYYRLSFTTERKEEVLVIIQQLQDRLKGIKSSKGFNRNRYTHGHFFKDPL